MHEAVRKSVAVVLSGVVIVSIVGPAAGAAAIEDPGLGSTAIDAHERIEWETAPPEAFDGGDLVVRFEPYDPGAAVDDESTGAGADHSTKGTNAEREATIEALQAHAASTQADLLEWAESTDEVEVTGQFWIVNAVALSIDEDVEVDRLAGFTDVAGVHEPFEVSREEPTAASADAAPERTDESVTYGLEMVGAPSVWKEFDTAGEGATVAVLDSGVHGAHPDLEVDTFQEFDERGNEIDSDPFDPSGQSHGTHVSGTIAGGDESGTAIGVAPEADLAVGAVLTNCALGGCSGTFEQIIGGMEWAVEDAEADVLSMSLGFGGKSDRMVEPIRNARSAGTLVVASAGNSGEGSSGSPGNVYDSLSVGAVDEDRSVARFSSGERISKGEWADPPEEWPDEYVVPTVTAPGVDVKSAQDPDGYGELSGTSMAAPHVAGVAALLASAYPEASAEEIEAAIESSAETPNADRDTRYGAGIVDAVAAMEALEASQFASAPMAAPLEDSESMTTPDDDRETESGPAAAAANVAAEVEQTLASFDPLALLASIDLATLQSELQESLGSHPAFEPEPRSPAGELGMGRRQRAARNRTPVR